MGWISKGADTPTFVLHPASPDAVCSRQYAAAIVTQPGEAGGRRYDSVVRRERAAQTRDRIVAAGSELAHEFASWDWKPLTFRAVADRAGVGERTVYRH